MSTTLAFDIIAKDRASNTFDKVGDSADKSSGKLKKWATVGAAAMAAGALVAGKALLGMAHAAAEDEKQQMVLARSMQNAAGASREQVAAVEDWIAAQGRAKGIADDELRPALARLVQATGDVGRSQKLAGLAMDVSAGTGKSLKSVTDALAKAQNGSLGGLSKMGVATKNADGSTRSLAQITRDLANLHGGQASAAADTNAGKMARLRVTYDEIKESVGAKLIPVLGAAADKTMHFIDQMQRGEGVGGRVAAVFTTITSNLGTIAPALAVVTTGLITYAAASRAVAIATAIQAAGTAGATGATWSLNAALRANPIGVVVTLLTALGVGLVVAYKKSETFRNIVNGVWASVKSGASAMWSGVSKTFGALRKGFDAVGRAGVWLWNKALQPAFRFIVSGVAAILRMWSSMLRALGKVPGFGWARTAANAMANAANKAQDIANNINKIPVHKRADVLVHTTYTYSGLQDPTRGRGEALGTSHAAGGRTLVGETGPEYVDLPPGSRVHTAGHTRAMAGSSGGGDMAEVVRLLRKIAHEQLTDGSTLKIAGGDAGRVAYLRTGY